MGNLILTLSSPTNYRKTYIIWTAKGKTFLVATRSLRGTTLCDTPTLDSSAPTSALKSWTTMPKSMSCRLSNRLTSRTATSYAGSI
ncbi:hypothetical protein CSAL01_00880 [Colletotrichum salicis]|uniref:Uncharacterized protein n=1 Tax=Colletotrichum salicis TaxID=1209931 RepID=A0A135RXG6_9PEZI|nr:hypothetical protein CSAL01_00880 [Colletotrichum salicis]